MNDLIAEVERLQNIATGGTQGYVDNANGFFPFPELPLSRLKTFKVKSGEQLYRTQEALAARQERNADNDDWVDAGEDDYTLKGDFFRGVAFPDDIVQGYFHSGMQEWVAIGHGKLWVTAVLTAELASGGSAASTVTINGIENTVTIHETLGIDSPLAADSTVKATWEDNQQRFEASQAACG